MNEMERMIFAAAFAAAFQKEWAFRVAHQGITEAMNHTSNGFGFAETADEAVKSYRNAMNSEDRNYLLAVEENWQVK